MQKFAECIAGKGKFCVRTAAATCANNYGDRIEDRLCVLDIVKCFYLLINDYLYNFNNVIEYIFIVLVLLWHKSDLCEIAINIPLQT